MNNEGIDEFENTTVETDPMVVGCPLFVEVILTVAKSGGGN